MPSVRATTAVSQSEESGQWRSSQGSFKCDHAHDADDDAHDSDDDGGDVDNDLDEWQCDIDLLCSIAKNSTAEQKAFQDHLRFLKRRCWRQ